MMPDIPNLLLPPVRVKGGGETQKQGDTFLITVVFYVLLMTNPFFYTCPSLHPSFPSSPPSSFFPGEVFAFLFLDHVLAFSSSTLPPSLSPSFFPSFAHLNLFSSR